MEVARDEERSDNYRTALGVGEIRVQVAQSPVYFIIFADGEEIRDCLKGKCELRQPNPST